MRRLNWPDHKPIANIIFTIAMCCVGVVVLLFLGKLLNMFQPWFSAILIGIGLFWNVRYWKGVFKSIRHSAHRSQLFYYVYQGTLSIVVVVVAILMLVVKGRYSYFLILEFLGAAVVLMIVAFVTDLGGIRQTRKALKAAAIDYQDEKEDEDEEEETSLMGQWPLIVGTGITGLVYIAVFLPITMSVVSARSLDPINVLLFVDFPIISVGSDFLPNIAQLWSSQNFPFLLSFGVMYGAANVAYGLLGLSIQKHGWIEAIITFNGLLFGYALTILIAFFLGVTPVLLNISQLSLAYVFLLAYTSRFVNTIIARWGWGTTAKYEHLITGANAVATSWILSRVLHEWSIIFSGITFYVCTFLSTSAIEIVIVGGSKLIFGGIPTRSLTPSITSLTDCVRGSPRRFWTSVGILVLITCIFPLAAVGIFYLFIRSI